MSHIAIYVGDGEIIHSTMGGLKKQSVTTYNKILVAASRPQYNSVGVERLGQGETNQILSKIKNIRLFQDEEFVDTQLQGILKEKKIGKISTTTIQKNKAYEIINEISTEFSTAKGNDEEITDAIFLLTEQTLDSNLIKEKEQSLEKIYSLAKNNGARLIIILPAKNIGIINDENQDIQNNERKKINNWIVENEKDGIIIDSNNIIWNSDTSENNVETSPTKTILSPE